MGAGTFGAEGILWIRSDEMNVQSKNTLKNKLEEDYTKDQVTMKEYIDPFTGNKNK